MKSIHRILTVTIVLQFSFSAVHSQIGTLDPTFGEGGIASVVFQNGDFKMYDSNVMADGKLLCYGKFFVSTANGFFPTVVRLNADGSGIDFSFGSNGVQVLSEELFVQDDYLEMAMDDQENIFVVATSVASIVAYKLSPDGELDLGFGDEGMIEIADGGILGNIIVQPDGKLIVAYTRANDFALARVNSNGSMDTSFGANGLLTTSVFGIDRAYGITLQPDGKILVSGTTDNGFGPMLGIVRLHENGSLDNSFGSEGKVSRIINGSDFAYSIAVTNAGKLLVTGRTTNGVFDQKGILAQFNEDGSEDMDFGVNGLVEIQLAGGADFFSDGLIQPDGKILATGIHNLNGVHSSFLIARINSDGTPDAGFGPDNNGTAIASLSGIDLHGQTINLDSNGDALVGGAHQEDNTIRVAKYITGLTLSSAENQLKTGFKIYPNPAATSVRVNLPSHLNTTNLSLTIHNSTGEEEYHNARFNLQKDGSIAVDHLASGIYFVTVVLEGEILHSRFVKN